MIDEKEQKPTTELDVSGQIQSEQKIIQTQQETIQTYKRVADGLENTIQTYIKTIAVLKNTHNTQMAAATATNARSKEHLKNTVIGWCFITAVVVGLCVFSLGAH